MAVIIAGSVLLAMGDNGFLYAAASKVFPWIGFMRYPVKLVALATLLIPLLAAFAIAEFEKSSEDKKEKLWGSMLAVASVCFALVAGLLWFAFQHPPAAGDIAATLKNGISRAGFLLLSLGVVAVAVTTAYARWQWMGRLGLLLCLWLDLATHTPNPNPTVPNGVYAPGLVRSRLQPTPEPGKSRALLNPEANYIFFHTMLSELDKDFLSHRAGLYSNCNLLDDVPKIDAFYSLYPREVWEVMAPVYIATNGYPARFADFLGASQVNADGQPLAWEPRSTSLPLATAGQSPAFADRTETVNGLTQRNFDVREQVYLPAELRGQVTVSHATEATVTVQRFGAHRVELDADARESSPVALAQTYYHWWHAYVDGKEVPLWRANHGFQALQVPAGRTHITLVYRDRAFEIGAVISFASLLISVAGWFRWRRSESKVTPKAV